MTDRKEVFDYLRNRQKAAEIEAKVNGINLWVLIGAIAVVSWQLLASIGSSLWDHSELVIRAILCAEALYMFRLLGNNSRRARGEIRYSQWRFTDIESPFLRLFEGALYLLPPLIAWRFLGLGWSVITLGLFGLIFFGFSVAAISSHLFNIDAVGEKFPKPDFGLTTRADILSDLFFGAAFALSILEQGRFAWEHQETFTMELAKQVALLSALYLLIVVTVQRKLQSNGIAWTYELETEVLLGSVSVEVAIRRIEHRGLGPRLQDVMDRFFDDLDRRFVELNTLFSECSQKLESVKDVPLQYGAERAARVQGATQMVSAHIAGLAHDCAEFGRYLEKLDQKNVGALKATLAPHLLSLKARHESYLERLQEAKAKLKSACSQDHQ